MGLLDFIFGKKKDAKTSVPQSKPAAKPQPTASRPATTTSSAPKTAELSIAPFVFESNQHQRYENGNPVQGLQECPRTIKVEKNVNGCSGYQLKNGDGYIVRMINGDTGQPQMSAKPMRVIKSTVTEVILRGYMVSAQTPFGFQDFDMSDYGLTVSLEDGKVVKCVLHMYDRNADIEYRKVLTKAFSQSSNKASAKEELTEVELYVIQALTQLGAGNDGDAVYHPLYKAWRSFQNNPDQLKKIINAGSFGKGMMIFLSYGTVTDIDDKQQLASIAYLFLSLAIQNNQNDAHLILTRLLVMLNNREAFEYTVSSVVNKDEGMLFMNMNPFKARDAMFKMEYADLSKDSHLLSVDIFAQVYQDLRSKIQSGFFGQNKSELSIITEGRNLHKEVTEYLVNKILEENDIDF